MEPAPAISTCMRASLNWWVRCTHAPLPPLALFIIPHAASRVSSRAFKNPFSTCPLRYRQSIGVRKLWAGVATHVAFDQGMIFKL